MNTRSAFATFRFYEELNDFLPASNRKRAFDYHFSGTPSVKDAIEAMGVPHTEVDLILVGGTSVDFSYLLQGGERISVYPTFERLDIAEVTRLRPEPLREPRFVLDVHLGRLARYMRLLGFDTAYRNDYSDVQIIGLSVGERRIILTRDRGILKHRAVTHGHWMRNTSPREQLREVVGVFDLRARVRPFTRCMECNGKLRATDRDGVLAEIPPRVASAFQDFSRCDGCARVYWRGSHYDQLARLVEELL